MGKVNDARRRKDITKLSGAIKLCGISENFVARWNPSRVMSKELQYPTMRQTSCNGIGEVLDRLHTCGWYWGAITNTEAMRILKSKPCGTFLLRDSSHSRHYFTLSVRTSRGITSIRVLFERGRFTLDNLNTELRQSIPNFDCVLKLICYYVHLSNNQDGRKLLAKPDKNVEEDTCVVLRKPLFREVPSLKHLCRRVINTTQLLRNVPRIKLPRTIESYLLKYPYPI